MNLPNQPSQGMLAQQPYNHFYGQNYTSQPSHRDPWTSQRLPQNPNVPRSGDAVFDPVSDLVDYSAWVNVDVGNWTTNNTDPNFLISPNEPLAPHENPFNFPRQSHHRAPETRVTVPSPSLPGSHTFINYNQSSTYFADDPMTESQFPPSSPDTSTMGSTVGHLSHSPYQTAISPQVSIPSPGGSDALFSSYQHSDSGMMVDSYTEQRDVKPVRPASPVQMVPSPTGTVPEMTFDASPEPESQPRPHATGKGSGRPGGRALGTHLEPKVAKAAHDMRKIVACWHCVLQRDKVRFWFALIRGYLGS